jgi:glycine/D-amino acid oxidase-like deaminating enzyme
VQQIPKRADVVVVGAGLMGAAAAWALSARGHHVVVLEARRAGHREGSSHGSSRVFRRAYREPHHIAMTGLAQDRWRLLEAESGTPLLTLTGGLDHGRDPQGLYEALRAEGVECELLSADAAGRRWPHMCFAGTVVHYGAAGVFDPELAMAEMLRLAARHGAVIVHECPVTAVEPSASGVRLRVMGGELRAATAVVAAGAWIESLLGGVVTLPKLTVTQQQVFHFARRERDDDSPWPIALHDGAPAVYGLPGGRDGVVPGNMKLGEHDPGTVTTADDRDGIVDAQSRTRMIDYVRRWWPGLEPSPIAAFSCLYTWTDDSDFVIDRVGPLVVLSPCSGHGAKFAPLIGDWAADLVEGRGLPFDRFGLVRRRASKA